MIVFPNAKINLGLRILNKRPDGYHDLESVFLPVGLTDVLEIVPSGDEGAGKGDRFNLSGIPLDARGDNLCILALRLLRERHLIPPVQLHLHKRIPTGAGLGGGSSDAAFTLRLLNELFGLGLEQPVLLEYASMLGSDCAFFILNEPCLASGRGEILESLSIDLSGYTLLLVMPGISIDTGKAYQKINPSPRGLPVKEVIQLAPARWRDRLTNHFEEPIFSAYPDIGKLKQLLYESGAVYASLTGSGSAVYGIFAGTPDIGPDIGRYPVYIQPC